MFLFAGTTQECKQLQRKTRSKQKFDKFRRALLYRVLKPYKNLSNTMDDLSYLEPGFDPSTLKVPELRRMLVLHEVQFPSSAKKAMLVDLFKEHISSKSSAILAARANEKQNSTAILDANLSSAISTSTPQVPKTRSSRRPRSSSIKSIRKSLAKEKERTKEAEDTTTEEEKPTEESIVVKRTPSRSRKSLTSTKTPKAEPRTEGKNEVLRETIHIQEPTVESEIHFSQDNPFQTPTSSIRGRKKSSIGRKSSAPASEHRVSPPQADLRLQQQYLHEPSPSRAIRYQLSPEPQTPLFSSDMFTQRTHFSELSPDVVNHISDGDIPSAVYETDEATENDRRSSKLLGRSSYTFPLTVFLSWIIVVGLLSAFMWWRSEKFKLGFCEVLHDTSYQDENSILANIPLALRPECTPCPAHARCFEDFKLECDSEFMPKYSIWSFGGLLPIPPSCVPDTQKVQRASILMDAALDLLRERYALVECDGKDNDPTLPVVDVQEKLYRMKSPSLTDEMFDELWEIAFRDLVQLEEVYQIDTSTITKVGSNSVARFPFMCILKRSIGQFILENGKNIILLSIAALALAVLHRATRQYQQRRSEVHRLTKQTLQILSTQQETSDADSTGFTPRFVIMSQLKDKLLDNFTDSAERRKVWEGVQKAVEANGNVRSRQMEIHGEIMRIWEWIGI
ncbi:Man1-Src1p-C-terminal domain-containing protein [Dipodascopsis uninucleata]